MISFLIMLVVLALASSATLAIVFCFRKRTDTFLIVVPVMFILYAVTAFVEPMILYFQDDLQLDWTF